MTDQYDSTLLRIDPSTNQVARRISVGNRPHCLAIAGGTVLVSVRQSGAGHRGGTLTVRTSDIVNYESILRLTSDGLVAYNQAAGLAGTQLVPDLALSLPTPTDGGKTYTFRLRPDLRYSNGLPVEASDVRQALERYFRFGANAAYYDERSGPGRRGRLQHVSVTRGSLSRRPRLD